MMSLSVAFGIDWYCVLINGEHYVIILKVEDNDFHKIEENIASYTARKIDSLCWSR